MHITQHYFSKIFKNCNTGMEYTIQGYAHNVIYITTIVWLDDTFCYDYIMILLSKTLYCEFDNSDQYSFVLDHRIYNEKNDDMMEMIETR